MSNNEQKAHGKDKPAETKVKDAGPAKAEPRKQELTDKELGAVTGGDIFSGQGGGSGRTRRGG